MTDERKIFRRSLHYYRHEKWQITALFAVILVGTLLSLMQAWPVAVLIDSVLMQRPKMDWMHQLMLAPLPKTRLGQLIGLALMTLALKLGAEFLNMVRALLGHHINYRGLMRVRRDLYRKLQSLAMSYHKTRPEGDTIYRLSYDTYGSLILLTTAITATVAAFTLVAMAIIMWSRHWLLTVMALSVVVPLYFIGKWWSKPMKHHTEEGKLRDSEFLTLVQRSVGSLKLTQAFGREHHEMEHFERAASANVRAWIKMHMHEVTYTLAVGAVFAVGSAIIFGFGGYLVYQDQILHHVANGMTAGDLVLMLTYLAQLYDPLQKLSNTKAQAQTGFAAARRMFELLDADSHVVASGHRPLPRQPRLISFRDVSFTYPVGKTILNGVTVDIKPGEMVAFVGPSGTGKSTLLNLLPRFYDPSSGTICLDGNDLRDLELKDVRRHIALVLQESIMLPTTVAENICYGRSGASEEEFRAAARLAGAADFIEALPDGYDTKIAEGGKNLSGGQRQRISIARALLSGAPILVMDEPTSALDAEHERNITDMLGRLKGKRTIILVSHRLSTVVHCDQIFVMNGGKIVEQGTHSELVDRGGLYYAMASIQMDVRPEPPPVGCEVCASRAPGEQDEVPFADDAHVPGDGAEPPREIRIN